MSHIRYVAIALITLALGYLIVGQGLATSALAHGDARLALRIQPHSVRALSLSSEQALVRNDLDSAVRDARLALTLVPRDVRALRVLGIATSESGNPLLGSKLLLHAGSLSWRDPITQLWLIRAAIDQRNYATAAQRIDAMLRADQLMPEMLKLMHQIAATPEARGAVIERLVEEPSWRRAFFVNMEYMPAGAEAGHAALISALLVNDQAGREEISYFLDHLIKAGRVAEAKQIWISTLKGTAVGLLANVFDGDFQLDPEAPDAQPRYPFEWTLGSDRGAEASILSPPLVIDELALRVRSGDGPAVIVQQTLALLPGSHQFGYATAFGSGYRPEAFSWRIRCAKNGAVLRLGQPIVVNAGGWRTLNATFEVPKENCAAQLLELHTLNGPDDSSREAWFDHLSVR